MIQRGSLIMCFFFCMSWCESFKSLEESHEDLMSQEVLA